MDKLLVAVLQYIALTLDTIGCLYLWLVYRPYEDWKEQDEVIDG